MRDQCPDCWNNRELGHSFCRSCGNELDCPECDSYRWNAASFCGSCGRRLIPRTTISPEKPSGNIMFWISVLAMVFVAVLLAVDLFALLINSFDVLIYAKGITYGLLILVPSPYVFLWFSGTGSRIYWAFLVAVIVLSFAHMGWEMYSKHFKSPPDVGIRGLEDTSAYWIGLLWPSTVVIQLLIMLIMLEGGYTLPDFGPEDVSYSMFTLASASVWEEIITRVLIIGLPLMVVALATEKKKPLRYLLGGFGINKASVILIVISSAVFGYAHYDGWGIIKIIPSFIFGLAAGYLYSKYGLYAAILLHFVNDYLQALLWLGFGEVSYTLMVLLLIGAGVTTTIILAVKGVSFTRNFMKRDFFPDSFNKD